MSGALCGESLIGDELDRALPLARVPAGDLRVSRLLREWPLPASLAAEVSRTASDALERVVPKSSRPALTLSSESGEVTLASGEMSLVAGVDALAPAFEIVRARDGARMIATTSGIVTRNGWIVPPGVATPVRDGDLIRADGVAWKARYDVARPRPLVEATGVRRSGRPTTETLSCGFTIVPFGERLHFAVDLPTARAVCDVILGGSGDHPFDATAIGRVERELAEWALRRAAHDAAAWIVQGASLAAAEHEWPERAVWCEAALRVGNYRGVAWLGATERAISLLSGQLGAQARASRYHRPAVSRIEALVAASVPLGHIPACDVATLESGDLFIAGDIRAGVADGLFGDGWLTVRGAEPTAIHARFEQRGNVLLAKLASVGSLDWRISMVENDSQVARAAVPDEKPFEALLDDLTVAVSIEIGRRRMALGELLAISSGDVLELNAPITAGVTIVVDGAPLGRGELVDVEGALGVRVTSIGGVR